jgi:ectoine hydroxylase-related dioxygenase (phytanoyl-CoA dioxygenase family)
MGYELTGVDRYFVTHGSGVLAVDSPRALLRYLDCLTEAGIDGFLYDYFGERPAISAKKSTLRRTPHNAPAGWHQDGHFLGRDIRALNIWAAFSDCGVDAPSLDVFAKHFDYFVEAGGPGIADDAITEENIARCGLEHIVRPEFKAGDALLFDGWTLHRTGIDETMTRTRYAVEMWFFAASKFPRAYVPLYL